MKSLAAAEPSAPHAAAVREDLHIPCRAEKHMEEDRQRSSPVPQKGNFNTSNALKHSGLKAYAPESGDLKQAVLLFPEQE